MTKDSDLPLLESPVPVEQVTGPLEARILRVLWSDGPSTVGHVADALGASAQSHPAYTTVMTVLARLYEKGILLREKTGRQWVYEAAADEAVLVDSLGQRAVDRIVDRYGTSALRQFAIRVADLDAGTRDQLIRLAHGEEP